MMEKETRLVAPCEELKESYLAACGEYHAESRTAEPGHDPENGDGWQERMFEDFENARMGLSQEGDAIPCTTWWLACGNEYIGTGHVRPYLTEQMERTVGHVDGLIRPSMRGRGYGTELLCRLLEKAAEVKVDPALALCSMQDDISAHVIRKNGGKMKDGVLAVVGKKKQAMIRYEIPVKKEGTVG